MVYFITDGVNIKIGYTSGSPINRLKKLQTGSSQKLTLIGYIDGNKNKEKELHNKFSNLRLNFKNEKVGNEKWLKELMGLSLKNVQATITDGKGKKLYSDFGEMLFTHFGVSGPLMLSASAAVNDAIMKEELHLFIDLKPALTKEQLDKRILREFDENKNRKFKNATSSLFPGKLTPVMIQLSGIDGELPVNEITKGQREQFVDLIKAMPLTLVGLRDFKEAIITKGGLNVKEINPSTMESKLVPGLYFAGEMIDCDAYTGGFNLQIAWSTGHLAGSHIE